MSHITIILGRLSKDPEPISNGQGCKLSIPINEKWKDKSGESRERVTWYDVSVWGKQAESCMAHLVKGRVVQVVGKMQVDEVEKDGVKRRYWGLRADHVQFIPRDTSGQDAAPEEPSEPSEAPTTGDKLDDSIPF